MFHIESICLEQGAIQGRITKNKIRDIIQERMNVIQ